MANVQGPLGFVPQQQTARSAGPAADAAGLPPVNTKALDLNLAQRSEVRSRKATCPFMGSAVKAGQLCVRNSVQRPLASIDDVIRLGDSGGGNLGRLVLKVFAEGNHAKMPGVDGRLTQPAPPGMLSLDFPGSQGAHPGHSGILMESPFRVNSGRFSQENWDRLVAKAKDGYLTRDAVGAYIAENLKRDSQSKVFGLKVGHKLAADVAGLVGAEGKALAHRLSGHDDWQGDELSPEQRAVFEKLTKLTGEDNLVGSSGEFGLLFAFLAKSPRTKEIDGAPALAVSDVKAMFVDGRLPDGWDQWPKTAGDWISNTTALTAKAAEHSIGR